MLEEALHWGRDLVQRHAVGVEVDMASCSQSSINQLFWHLSWHPWRARSDELPTDELSSPFETQRQQTSGPGTLCLGKGNDLFESGLLVQYSQCNTAVADSQTVGRRYDIARAGRGSEHIVRHRRRTADDRNRIPDAL